MSLLHTTLTKTTTTTSECCFWALQRAHRLRVVFKHFSGLFFGALFLHALPLQVPLLRLLENLICSPVSAQKLVRLLGGQWNYREGENRQSEFTYNKSKREGQTNSDDLEISFLTEKGCEIYHRVKSTTETFIIIRAKCPKKGGFSEQASQLACDCLLTAVGPADSQQD